MDHAEFDVCLKKAYLEASGGHPQKVRFPSAKHIHIRGDASCATLQLTPAAVQANMQNNEAAFEGWALALMKWCGVQRVAVDWETPGEGSACPHYQRFLYGLARF